MNLKKKIFLMLFLTVTLVLSTPPDLSPTQISQDIKDSATGDRGYYHYMKVSVNPERTKVAFSPHIMNYVITSTELAAGLEVFDVQPDFTLNNKKEYTGATKLAISSFFGTNVVVIFDASTEVVQILDIGSTGISQNGADLTNFSSRTSINMEIKKEKISWLLVKSPFMIQNSSL